MYGCDRQRHRYRITPLLSSMFGGIAPNAPTKRRPTLLTPKALCRHFVGNGPDTDYKVR